MRSISKDKIAYIEINDARLKKDIIQAGLWNEVRLNSYRRLNMRKMVLGPLGEVYPCND